MREQQQLAGRPRKRRFSAVNHLDADSGVGSTGTNAAAGSQVSSFLTALAGKRHTADTERSTGNQLAAAGQVASFLTALAGKRTSADAPSSFSAHGRTTSASQTAVARENPYVSEPLLQALRESGLADKRRQLHEYVPGSWIRWAHHLRLQRQNEIEWEKWLRYGMNVTSLAVSEARAPHYLVAETMLSSRSSHETQLEPWDELLVATSSTACSYAEALKMATLFDPTQEAFRRPFDATSLARFIQAPPYPNCMSIDFTLPEERRRIRRARRLQKRQEMEHLRRAGAAPPPLAHRRAFHGVLAALEARQTRAGAAYGALATDQLRQVAQAMVTERMRQHEARNEANKRSATERALARKKKLERDRQRGLVTKVYALWTKGMTSPNVRRLLFQLSAAAERIGVNGFILEWRERFFKHWAGGLRFAVFIAIQGGETATRQWDALLERRMSHTEDRLLLDRVWQSTWIRVLAGAAPVTLRGVSSEDSARMLTFEAQVAELYDIARARFLLHVAKDTSTPERNEHDLF